MGFTQISDADTERSEKDTGPFAARIERELREPCRASRLKGQNAPQAELWVLINPRHDCHWDEVASSRMTKIHQGCTALGLCSYLADCVCSDLRFDPC
jgi:hypothetical protein